MSVANGTFTRTNSFIGETDRIIPRFFTDEVPDELASQQQGRPIFRTVERVEIILPGNPHTRPVHAVTDEHRQRWPKHYADFKAGREMAADGTPLEQWPILKRAQVLELKALGFMTVENIASMDDLAAQRIGMAGTRLRVLAQAYLDEAKAGSFLAKATAENDAMRSEIEELKGKIAEQGKLLDMAFAELQGIKNAPSPAASVIPGMLDPIEQAKRNPEPAAGSSLDTLAKVGKRKA